MAWIKVEQSLLTHRKTIKAARLLDIDRAQVIGHLVSLWCWAIDNATDGIIEDMEDVQVAAAWEGDPQSITSALTGAGFLDLCEDGWRIHDWDEYGGRLMDRRKLDAARQRRRRDAIASQNTPEHAVTSNGRHADVTRQSRVEQSRAEGEQPPLTPPAPRPAIKAVDEPFIMQMVAKWGSKYGGEAAVRQEISDALNHKASNNWKNKQQGVDGWLRRGRGLVAQTNKARTAGTGKGW